MIATGGLASSASNASPATRAATTLVGMVPKRTPPHAVMKDPATAPRLSASAKVRALPRSVPSPCMSLGSQVPRPYQASRVTTVVSANRMLMARNRGPSRAPKPWPGLWPGVGDRAVGQRLARDRHQHRQRDQGEQEHRLPAPVRDHRDAQQRGDRAADRHAGHHHGRDGGPPFRCDEFCGKGIGGGHQAAEAKAGDQAQGAEHHRAGRQGAQVR